MALYNYTEGQWVLTPDGDKGFVLKIAYGGYNVHVPGKHVVMKDKLDSKWYTEGQILGLSEEICEDARKAFIDWALDKRYFDLLEG